MQLSRGAHKYNTQRYCSKVFAIKIAFRRLFIPSGICMGHLLCNRTHDRPTNSYSPICHHNLEWKGRHVLCTHHDRCCRIKWSANSASVWQSGNFTKQNYHKINNEKEKTEKLKRKKENILFPSTYWCTVCCPADCMPSHSLVRAIMLDCLLVVDSILSQIDRWGTLHRYNTSDWL